MTLVSVDVFLARKVDVKSVTWAPAVVPTRGGAIATVAFGYRAAMGNGCCPSTVSLPAEKTNIAVSYFANVS